MIEHGTFRSAQYVDLTSQAYPAVEVNAMHQALRPDTSLSMLTDAVAAPGDRPEGPSSVIESSEVEQQPMDSNVPETPPNVEPPSSHGDVPQVESIFDCPPDDMPQSAPASSVRPASSGPASSSRPDANNGTPPYGPIRRKVPSKAGPLTLHRPACRAHDNFVEVMQDVIPQMVQEAVSSMKREAGEEIEGHVEKSA